MLNSKEYEEFLKWTLEQTLSQARGFDSTHYQYDELGVLDKKSWLPLEDEIEATCARLSLVCNSITKFRKLADELENSFWTSTGRVGEILNEIEKQFGQSLWLIEARISFLQLTEGLEAQKRYAHAVRKSARGGLASYFAYYMSVKTNQWLLTKDTHGTSKIDCLAASEYQSQENYT